MEDSGLPDLQSLPLETKRARQVCALLLLNQTAPPAPALARLSPFLLVLVYSIRTFRTQTDLALHNPSPPFWGPAFGLTGCCSFHRPPASSIKHHQTKSSCT